MQIDLNADVGEGFGSWSLGDDTALLQVITSANVACGFHAGDPKIMRAVCREAVERGVAIGAQVGYRDLVGFGRRKIDVEPEDLQADVLYQLGALDAFARAAGDRVRYLKPHGALYNTAAVDPAQAGAIVQAVLDYDPRLPILTLPDCELARAAAARGVRCVAEAFVDRAYQADGTLQPRSEPGAVLSDPAAIAARATTLALHGEVVAADGRLIQLSARSLCVHGDTPNAVAIARAVRAALLEGGLELVPFVELG